MMSILEMKNGESALLLEMPHSGLAGTNYVNSRATDGIPIPIARNVRFEADAVRRTIGYGVDAAVPDMTGYEDLLSGLPVSGIRATLARAFVDMNRDRSEASGLAVLGKPGTNHHGVIWARTVVTGLSAGAFADQTARELAVRAMAEPMLREPFTPEAFHELMTKTYDPYHDSLRRLHRRIVAHHGLCVHLALHSLPPVAVALADDSYVAGPPVERGRFRPDGGALPDVILIHNSFRAAHPRFVRAVRDEFQKAGLIVEDGVGPFLGDNGVTGMYGNPDTGVHVIGIEHVTHGGIEPDRHKGGTTVDAEKARAFRGAYRSACERLLAETR